MRIGIITLAMNINCGCILQAYALQTMLERMGHSVRIIDASKELPLWRLALRCGYKMAMAFRGQTYHIYHERKDFFKRTQIFLDKESFCGKYMHIMVYDRFSDIQPDDYDAFVVGSDQVWRPSIFLRYYSKMSNAFLDFTVGWNVRRVAYAASFGIDRWEFNKKETENCRKLVRLFNAVSTREQAGVKLCKQKFGIDAQLVLDPTLLLERKDYDNLINAADTQKSTGTLFCYIFWLSPQKKALIEKTAEELKLTPFSINDNYACGPCVEQWLASIRDAEFVITDSFHGCVFSILFKKQFVVFGKKEHGLSRIESLLNIFGLENRLILETEDTKYTGGGGKSIMTKCTIKSVNTSHYRLIS